MGPVCTRNDSDTCNRPHSGIRACAHCRRRLPLRLAENPPPFWSRAYRCYRGRSGKNLTRHERRFADHMRALVRRASELEG